MPLTNKEAFEQHRADIAADAAAWEAKAKAAEAWETASASDSEAEWEEVALQSPAAPTKIEAAPMEQAPASNPIIDTVPELRAAIGNMDSGEQRALRDEIGKIAVVTLAQERADKKAADAADAEAKKAAKASASTAKKAAKARKQRLREQAALERAAHKLQGKALKQVAAASASINRAVCKARFMSLEEIGATLSDDDSELAKVLRYVCDKAGLIAGMVTYVRLETGESPKWATDASVRYRSILRALAVFHERSEEPLATAVHREKALNITQYEAWHALGLDAEDESDSDDEDNTPITNLRKRRAQSPASGSDSEDDEPAENGDVVSDSGDDDSTEHQEFGHLRPAKCPRVEVVDSDAAEALLPPLRVAAEADPLLPAGQAAMEASNGAEWAYNSALSETPPPWSGDEDMRTLP